MSTGPMQVTVWACKTCGLCGKEETCGSCGGTMAQIAEADALNRFMVYYEPETGWYDYDTMRRDWLMRDDEARQHEIDRFDRNFPEW